MHTHLGIRGADFLVNGELTYGDSDSTRAGRQAAPQPLRGLVFNARFIQGIFDDAAGRDRYARFGRGPFDPDENTNGLIAALPEWYKHGLRAFTVGFQGGGPFFTIPNREIDNNPFGSDGRRLDDDYAERMDRLIRGADEAGFVVIVSFLYQGQIDRISAPGGILNATRTASRFIRENEYANVIIEVANEHDVGAFRDHPIVSSPEGAAALLTLAREESGGRPVGMSGGGGVAFREVVDVSDVVLIHGNGQTRQQYANLVSRVRSWAPSKPIVCNEDSPCIGNLRVAAAERSSWGYYNNMTKQEPPVDWSVTSGEDRYFAVRMAQLLGIDVKEPKEKYLLQGLAPHDHNDNLRWIRVASLYPESIDFVRFFRNGSHAGTVWDEPFSLGWMSNFNHRGVETVDGERWTAIVHLGDGSVVELDSDPIENR